MLRINSDNRLSALSLPSSTRRCSCSRSPQLCGQLGQPIRRLLVTIIGQPTQH